MDEIPKEDIKKILSPHILKKSLVIKHKNKIIDTVMCQTSYTYNETILKLALFNYNHINVIRDYLKPMKERIHLQQEEINHKENSLSLQQKMMSEIRYFMDDVSKQYEMRKMQNNTE